MNEKIIEGMQKELHEVEQVLGKALGYPAYADDPKNFPGATEKDGVCVGEHTPATLALEMVERFKKLEAIVAPVLADYDCPLGSIGKYTTEEAVVKHCICKGQDWCEENCPIDEECWKILLRKGAVEMK